MKIQNAGQMKTQWQSSTEEERNRHPWKQTTNGRFVCMPIEGTTEKCCLF